MSQDPGGTVMQMDTLTGIVAFLSFIFSIIVHENAHGLAAEHYGDPTARMLGRITMNPMPHIDPVGSILVPLVGYFSGFLFGWAKPVPVDSSNLRNPVKDNAIVAAAGPASNLLLALGASILWIIVGLVFKHVPGLYESAGKTKLFFDTLCWSMIWVNCILAVFNLLPIPPLDGHWILMRFLPRGPREAFASVGRFGFIILLLLLMSGALRFILGPPLNFVIRAYTLLVDAGIRLL